MRLHLLLTIKVGLTQHAHGNNCIENLYCNLSRLQTYSPPHTNVQTVPWLQVAIPFLSLTFTLTPGQAALATNAAWAMTFFSFTRSGLAGALRVGAVLFNLI